MPFMSLNLKRKNEAVYFNINIIILYLYFVFCILLSFETIKADSFSHSHHESSCAYHSINILLLLLYETMKYEIKYGIKYKMIA